MTINGLKLPAVFVADLESGRFVRERGSWPLCENKSAYNEPLETELGAVFDEAQIQQETDELHANYNCVTTEDIEGYTKIYGISLGEIPYIWDFLKIVCFAMAGDGSHFCFDYRANEDEPSVIWWADVYWQRIAPNYESFVELFDFTM